MTLTTRTLLAALATVTAALGVGSTSAAGTPVSAAGPVVCPASLTAGSPVTPTGGQRYVICSGKVPSFDGTPLDTDVTIPTAPTSTPRPLMLMFHGWGNSKTEWESTTLAGDGANLYHWNNAWFASLGYVVLNYTARGFHQSCGKDPGYTPPAACTGKSSWTHVADRRWEIHDSQYLAGLLVDAGLAAPDRIVATGGSYGGGQSWDFALAQNKVVASTSTNPAAPVLSAWTSPVNHLPMKIKAAAPMYPWTDLADALVQNGRASDGANGGPPDGPHHSPIGVDKQSYVAGLFAAGGATAQYAPPTDATADLSGWFAAINAGEPYSASPKAQQALAETGGAFRSPLAMPVPTGAAEVPVFVIQGHTDPLFPATQALDMVTHLRAADPNWPVTVFLGDVGHSYAANPHDIWQQAHTEGNQWLASVMAGSVPANPRVTVTTTACAALPSQTHQTYTGSSYGALADAVLHLPQLPVPASQQTVSSNNVTSEGTKTDPIANSGCRTMAASQSDPNQAVYVWAVPAGTLVGAPTVTADVSVSGISAEVAARLWEVDPAGNQTLITRTVYRLEETTPNTTEHLAFELYPQAWRFTHGDLLKLELTQNDSPVWRPDTAAASTLTYTRVALALPLVSGPPPVIAETPWAPAMPVIALVAAAAAFLVRRRRHRTVA